MKMKANFLYKPSNFQIDDCQIEKVVELSYGEFCDLKLAPLRDRAFIAENKECMFSQNGVMHCLLALGENNNDGILIEAEGYNYPRYAAYIPGMRDIINAEMDRAADFIIQQGTENTYSGSWYSYFPDLEEHLELTIREGSGFEKFLLDALSRRQEVAGVEIIRDCIDISYYTDFCLKINTEDAEEENGIAHQQIPGSGMSML